MKRRNLLMGGVAAVGLGACTQSKFRQYYGPRITGIVVNKGEREMFLLHNGQVIEDYKIDLGFAPIGDKEREGDGKTPEGRYRIDLKNPKSQFHLSLRISYPNADDRAGAATRGDDPGGDIYIHGTPGRRAPYSMHENIRDWTHGCIAVSDADIEELWRLVSVGATVEIKP